MTHSAAAVTDPQPNLDPSGVITLDGLSVSFGGRPILKTLRGELRGRSIGLLGPNGAGKTTLIHTLLGFHPPSSGSARSEEHTSELQSRSDLVCRLLLEKKNQLISSIQP